jgi:hypothetical protein
MLVELCGGGDHRGRRQFWNPTAAEAIRGASGGRTQTWSRDGGGQRIE